MVGAVGVEFGAFEDAGAHEFEEFGSGKEGFKRFGFVEGRCYFEERMEGYFTGFFKFSDGGVAYMGFSG